MLLCILVVWLQETDCWITFGRVGMQVCSVVTYYILYGSGREVECNLFVSNSSGLVKSHGVSWKVDCISNHPCFDVWREREREIVSKSSLLIGGEA